MASEKTPSKKATFRKIPRKAQIYYTGLYLTGFTLVLFFILKGAINEKNWETALLFLFLAALIEGQPLFTFADGSTTSSGSPLP